MLRSWTGVNPSIQPSATRLHANNAQVLVSESTWVGLVQSIAERGQFADPCAYTQTYGLFFTWIMRILSNWETAEELTLDVFHDVWRRASTYDPAGGSVVVGWIMNQGPLQSN